MQELLLVNPRKRAKSRKPRSAAQKAATRRLVAMNRGGGKKRRRNPIAANPAKRRSARRAPVRAARGRRRRNPIAGKPMSILHPALIGALGATTVNTVLAQLGPMLPASLMTGNALLLTKAAAALGLAVVGNKLGMKGSTVAQMAEGSLTVTLHDAILMLAQSAGVTQLAGVRAYPPRQNLPRAVNTPKLGQHVSNVAQLLPVQRQKVSGFGF